MRYLEEETEWHADTGHVTNDQNSKFWKFKTADCRHYENVFHYISAAKTDFGKIWYADASLDSECDYVKKLSSLQIQNDAFLKSFFGYRLSERPYYDPVSSVGTLGAMQFRGNGYKTAKKCLN